MLEISPIILIIIASLFIVGLMVFLWWYNSPQHKGKIGEKRVHDILMQLSDEYNVFDDVVLTTNRGTTQIDHIVVSKYGVLAIETKNYRGDIYGDDNRKEWTQLIVTNVRYKNSFKTYTYVTKNHFYNPVKQAYGHVYEIKEKLKYWSNIKITPIVVFTGRADISNVETSNLVIYDDQLLSTIQNQRGIYLSDDDVKNITRILNEKNLREVIDNKTHIRNIRANKNEYDKKLSLGICPKCGGSLIQRKGKYGTFYGCSNYPKCKYTHQ
ncbi:MAG: NERD domain-containing protein [Prevotella sp.]|nr:NERD domain-containing protein [Prevotella sp.]MBR1840348.1 NERD domain-containing protein [Prevotella sp.]